MENKPPDESPNPLEGIHVYFDSLDLQIINEICNNQEKNIRIPVKTIAHRLNLSEGRVRSRLTVVYSKLGLSQVDDVIKREELFKIFQKYTGDVSNPEENYDYLYDTLDEEFQKIIRRLKGIIGFSSALLIISGVFTLITFSNYKEILMGRTITLPKNFWLIITSKEISSIIALSLAGCSVLYGGIYLYRLVIEPFLKDKFPIFFEK